MIQILDWDSDFFGRKVGKVSLNKDYDPSLLEREIAKQNYDLVYVFSDQEILPLSDYFIEEKVTFYKNNLTVEAIHRDPYEVIEITSHTDHGEVLKELALLSGRYSRFKMDNKLNDHYSDLYIKWLEQSLKRIVAQQMLGVLFQNELVGFVSLTSENQSGKIGLIAVSEPFWGKGIGRLLINKAHQWYIENGFDSALVVTQKKNTGACKLYEKMGYHILKKEYIYHWHRA